MSDIHVITLAYANAGIHSQSASQTLQQTLQSCHKHRWPVQIFNAINGYNLDHSIWQNLDLKSPKIKSTSVGKFENKPGAQGCFLSHFLLWSLCSSSNNPIIILEDDVRIIGSLPTIETGFDLIKLHRPRAIKHHPVMGEWSPGAFGYWLSPIGANKLINFSRLNGPGYNDKFIGSKILNWTYIDKPIVRLMVRRGSSTNPEQYPY